MRQFCAGVLAVMVGASVSVALLAEERRPWRSESDHFVLHTDLSAAEAAEYLARMEATLEFASHYWRRPSSGRIECYLIADVKQWPESALPNALARIVVESIGGVTISQSERTTGGQAGAPPTYAARIYASTDVGVVEHEIMHAYCSQNFGATGPEWYKEGMAELAGFGETHAAAVRCPAARLELLRSGRRRSSTEIRNVGFGTQRIGRSLQKMLVEHAARGTTIPLDAWTETDAAQVRRVRVEYLWSWSLCHFLVHNPNYCDRFRMVGEAYVSGGKDMFEQVFAPMADELAFEYTQFLAQIDTGYRIDLCHWEWHRRFNSLDRVPVITTRCKAARGWQPAELLVKRGERYTFEVAGRWSTARGERPHKPLACKASGGKSARRQGRLLGIVLSGYELSTPIVLGEERSFVAPASGKLYLRCEDDWHALEDNSGELRIRFARPQHGPAKPLEWTAN